MYVCHIFVLSPLSHLFLQEWQQIQDAGILLAQHQHVNENSVDQCSFLKRISKINLKNHFTSVRNTKARLDISQ